MLLLSGNHPEAFTTINIFQQYNQLLKLSVYSTYSIVVQKSLAYYYIFILAHLFVCYKLFVPSQKGGDSGTKRTKVDQDRTEEILTDPHMIIDNISEFDEYLTLTHLKCDKSSSSSHPPMRTREWSIDQLPKKMHEMMIGGDKVNHSNDKVFVLIHFVLVINIMPPVSCSSYFANCVSQENDGPLVNGTETGQIIATTIGGQNGDLKQVTLPSLIWMHGA